MFVDIRLECAGRSASRAKNGYADEGKVSAEVFEASEEVGVGAR